MGGLAWGVGGAGGRARAERMWAAERRRRHVSRVAAGPGAWRAPTWEGGPSIRYFKNLNFKAAGGPYRRRQRGTPGVGLDRSGQGGGGRPPDLGAVVWTHECRVGAVRWLQQGAELGTRRACQTTWSHRGGRER